MKKNRIIFYVVFALFHLFIFGFTAYMDSQKSNYNFLFSMLNKLWLLKYGSLVGLLLLLIDFIWMRRDEKAFERERLKHENEMTTLKAKLFDLQEDAKRTNLPPQIQP